MNSRRWICVQVSCLNIRLEDQGLHQPRDMLTLLFPSVAQRPMVSLPKGEELPFLRPRCCVSLSLSLSCRCANDLLPYQCLHQPLHRLTMCPSVVQHPIVSFSQGEELPFLLLTEKCHAKLRDL